MSITIVGAGVIGLSCAFELSELGEQVTVIDAGAVGAGASAGNAGWIVPFLSTPRAAPGAVRDALKSFTSPEGPARMHPHLDPGFAGFITRFLRSSTQRRSAPRTVALQAMAAHAIAHLDSMAERGVEFEQYAAGLAVVFKEVQNLEHYEALAHKMRALGYSGATEVYRGRDVASFDPAIRHDVAGVMHLVSERHVRPETVTSGLAKAVLGNGGQVIEHDAVSRIASRAGRWVTTSRSGRQIESDQVLVAAGHLTGALLRPLGVRLPLEAAKGTSMTARGTGTVPTHALKLYENMVACSPFGDSVRLSGTFDLGRRDTTMNRKRLDMVVRHGLSYLEDWRPTDVEIEWVGHRPTSSDDTPIIGEVTGRAGLYVATGHGTLGVTLGPVTGHLVAQEMSLQQRQPLLEPFRPQRFGARNRRPHQA